VHLIIPSIWQYIVHFPIVKFLCSFGCHGYRVYILCLSTSHFVCHCVEFKIYVMVLNEN
jgi:hypothetical protein